MIPKPYHPRYEASTDRRWHCFHVDKNQISTQALKINIKIVGGFKMTVQEDITKIYIGYFGRAGDPEGFNYWIGEATDGGDGPGGRPPLSLREIAASFSVQPESTSLYPFLANPLVADSTNFITQVYQNLFNRNPDAEGLAYWKGELAAAAGDPQAVGAMIINIISGAQNSADGQDRTTIDNKVEVGLDWVQSTANVPNFIYEGLDATKASAKGVIDPVDDTAGSVANGKAETDAFIAGGAGQPVNTVNLTTGVDALIGTGGDDLFNGTSGTFNTGDSVDGAGGTDTLRSIEAFGGFFTPTLTSIEMLTILATHTSATTIDMAASSGLMSATLENSSGALILSNQNGIIDLTASNTTTSAGLNVNYTASSVAGTTDVQKLALNNAVLPAGIVINGVETIELTATGTNTAASITGNINFMVDGAGSLETFVTSTENTGTYDASASTGNQIIGFAAGKGYTVTGGSGNDSFELSGTTTNMVMGGDGDDMLIFGASLDDSDMVNGGDGRDILAIDNEFGLTGEINAATDVEVLMLINSSDGLNANDYTSINTFDFAGGPHSGRVNITGVQTSDRFIFSSDQGFNDEAVRFTGQQVGQSVTMELQAQEGAGGEVVIQANTNTNNAAAVGFNGGISTVTIDSTGMNDASNMIHAVDRGSSNYYAFDNQSGPSNFIVTGTQDLNIGARVGDAMTSSSDTFGFRSSVNLTAEDFTGDLRVAGSNSADVITGGMGADIIYGMNGDDALTGGDGVDQFRFVGDNSTDMLLDFTAGTDKIGFNTTIFDLTNTTQTSEGATLSSDDYIENRNGITDIGSADDHKVIELQTGLSSGQISNDAGAASEAFVLVFNTTTSKGELWYDSNWGTSGGRTQVATLDTVDDLAGIQGLSNTDFVEFMA